MTSAAVTIAWTEAEVVLFGPESRFVRQPLAADDDRPALILETWRTEFPDIGAAQLLAGKELSAAPDVARLAQLAAAAGLRLEIAPPPGELRGPRSHWTAWRGVLSRVKLRAVVIGATLVGALLIGGWRWSTERERARLSRLTAAEREHELAQAETAEMSRRRQRADDQTRALLGVCSVPAQFQAEWLAAVATAVPPSIVLDTIELNGECCRVTGHTVTGAPGADGAVAALRQAIFGPAWTMDKSAAPQTGASFRLEAVAGPATAAGAAMAESRPDEASAARARLPDAIAVQALLSELAPGWRIEARGAETTLGIERRSYALAAVNRDSRAWTDVLQLAYRLKGIAGIAIESMALVAAPGENGSLEKAAVEVSVRLRAGR